MLSKLARMGLSWNLSENRRSWNKSLLTMKSVKFKNIQLLALTASIIYVKFWALIPVRSHNCGAFFNYLWQISDFIGYHWWVKFKAMNSMHNLPTRMTIKLLNFKALRSSSVIEEKHLRWSEWFALEVLMANVFMQKNSHTVMGQC